MIFGGNILIICSRPRSTIHMLTYPKGGSRKDHHPADPAKPLISIIIVTLNAEVYLRACLHSIIKQRYKNIELLIFDGLSTDATVDIIKEHDSHISYWQSRPDKGIYDAMNKAAKITKGEYVYFLGADDKLLPGFSDMCEALTHKSCVYYGDMSYNGEVTSRKKYSAYRLSKETICHQAIFYPRSVFEDYSYDLQYPLVADWVLNLMLWSDRRFKFMFLPHVIADFSLAGASSLSKDENFIKDQGGLVKKHLGPIIYIRFCLKKLKTRYSIRRNKDK